MNIEKLFLYLDSFHSGFAEVLFDFDIDFDITSIAVTEVG